MEPNWFHMYTKPTGEELVQYKLQGKREERKYKYNIYSFIF